MVVEIFFVHEHMSKDIFIKLEASIVLINWIILAHAT